MADLSRWEHELDLIEIQLLFEQCNQLTAESYQTLVHLRLIQEWLADLETRAEKLAERVRSQTH
jgi:hypothetical protein